MTDDTKIEEEMIKDKALDEFDVSQAEKLLESIRFMSDLRKFPIQKPNSITMELGTMQDWLKWYTKTVEWNGRDGTDTEVMKMVYNISADLEILVKRVEEGYRLLLRVLSRRNIKIESLTTELENYKEALRICEKNEQTKKISLTQSKTIAENPIENPVMNESSEEQKEKVTDEPKPTPRPSKGFPKRLF